MGRRGIEARLTAAVAALVHTLCAGLWWGRTRSLSWSQCVGRALVAHASAWFYFSFVFFVLFILVRAVFVPVGAPPFVFVLVLWSFCFIFEAWFTFTSLPIFFC